MALPEGGKAGRKRRSGRIKVQPRDNHAIWTIGVHGYMTAPQIKLAAFDGWDDRGQWCPVSDQAVYRRLKKLCGAGLLEHRRTWYGDHGVYRATRDGLELAGLDVAPARVDKRDYEHDLRVVDLALRITGYTGDGWIPERMIRSHLKVGMSIGRVPDGLLLGPGGERWAVELEVSGKESQRYNEACAKYARRHRYRIPQDASEMEGMEEYIDDYFGSGGEVDGVVWYFFSERKRLRALAEAEKVLASYGRQRRRIDHLRFLFDDASQPAPPPFEKWDQQQERGRREREREAEERGWLERGPEHGSGGWTGWESEEQARPLPARGGEIAIADAAIAAGEELRRADEEERIRAERERDLERREREEARRRRRESVKNWFAGRGSE